jgi:hypothetical protein
LSRDGLAQDDRPRGPQTHDERGDATRDRVRQPRRAGGRGPALDIDQVFDADRNSVQRPAPIPGGQLAIELTGPRQRTLAIDTDPGMDFRFPGIDLRQATRNQVDASAFPVSNRLRNSGNCFFPRRMKLHGRHISHFEWHCHHAARHGIHQAF